MVKENNQNIDDIKLDPEAAAAYLGSQNRKMSVGTLAVWRCTKRYDLPYVKIGSRVYYKLSDLKAFVERNTYYVGGSHE